MNPKVKKEIKSIVLIIVVIFAFRSSFFEPFRIPSGSMIPTLNIGDFVLVNKFSYGLKVPYSDLFGAPIYLTDFKNPKRGDVIVFKAPHEDINMIKRLIGLPGDTIEVIDKNVYINGELVATTPIDGQSLRDLMVEKYQKVPFNYYKTKTGQKEHVTITTNSMTPLDNVEKFTVPPHKFFAMGDNRDFSSDSRVWGFVPQENIKGRAILTWFSLSLPFGEHNFRFRFENIGNLL